jgi:hypothetical protein
VVWLRFLEVFQHLGFVPDVRANLRTSFLPKGMIAVVASAAVDSSSRRKWRARVRISACCELMHRLSAPFKSFRNKDSELRSNAETELKKVLVLGSRPKKLEISETVRS